jgi:hypothetical protein
MALTRKDLLASIVAALVMLVYVANVQGWSYLGSNRWAALTMLAVGAISCSVGARIEGENLTAPVVLLGLLGVASLVLAIVAIVTAAQWALMALAIVLIALWVGATLRHSITSGRPLAT